MSLELYYWPGIQGRGEFVRLALEAAGAPYRDVAREDGGLEAMLELMSRGPRPPFAPPFLKDGDLVIGQTALILFHLGPKLGLAPKDEAGRLFAHQIQLTIADLVAEAHDAHHPVSVDLYYEDQKPEALRRAEAFRESRMPKFLGWFETLLAEGAADGWLLGDAPCYADLSLFQAVEGLAYAFPRAAARALKQAPHVASLRERARALPRIAAYLGSPRRLPFNENGIFRRYLELDG